MRDFSYGGAPGAGKRWAHLGLLNGIVRGKLSAFCEGKDTSALVIYNGRQFLLQLRTIILGAPDWPDFKANRGELFEARMSVVEVVESTVPRWSPSGSQTPVLRTSMSSAEMTRARPSHSSARMSVAEPLATDRLKVSAECPCAASKEGCSEVLQDRSRAGDGLVPCTWGEGWHDVRGDEVEGQQEQNEVQPSKASGRYGCHCSVQMLEISRIPSCSRLGGSALAQTC